MRIVATLLTLSLGFVVVSAFAETEISASAETYAERLGWPEGTRALILHVDDAGMSLGSNRGTMRAIEEGVATSLSVMMPTPWVPQIVRWINRSPEHDAGLHLTLTSEWRDYRWPPLSGIDAAGLIDPEGAMWANVADVLQHASADEVEREIRAQLSRARDMGFEPTHLDSHMGTLFAETSFLERYFKVGIEEGIPVMFPGGHNYFIAHSNNRLAPLSLQGQVSVCGLAVSPSWTTCTITVTAGRAQRNPSGMQPPLESFSRGLR